MSAFNRSSDKWPPDAKRLQRRDSLNEWETAEAMAALRAGIIDAMLIPNERGGFLYAAEGADEPYRLLVESLNEGALTLLCDGTILYCNASFAAMSGYDAGQLVGTSFASMLEPSHRPLLEALLETSAHGAGRGEFSLRSAGGTDIRVRISMRGMTRQGLQAVSTVVTDLTAEKELEHELRRKNEVLLMERSRAEAASRAKSAFLATVSHEIRTPLNAILGMTDLLAESPLRSREREFVETLQRAGENLLKLINDVLDLSRVESGRVELECTRLSIRDVITRTVKLFAPTAGAKSLGLSCTISPDVPEAVIGDGRRLQQVLANLLGNAVKFTGQGRIAVEADWSAGWLDLRVSDTGIGIAADKLPIIFDDFTQADSSLTRQYGGSGLGLAICKRLAELMGGTIQAKSELGNGATFSLRVPFEIAKPGPKPDELVYRAFAGSRKTTVSGTAAAITPRLPLRILAADDCSDNRFLLKTFLDENAFSVTFVEDGKQAVDEFSSRKYDVILMDMHMPRMDGLTATRLIRSIERDHSLKATPVIALTASAMPEDVEACRLAGCDAHLAKPISKRSLCEAIQATDRIHLQ